MQQVNQPTLLQRAPQLLTRTIHHLMTTEPVFVPQVRLLTPQPVHQRRLFLDRAISAHWSVFFQLMPKTAEGYPVNTYGQVNPLGNDRYLINSHQTSYVVGFDQIRYIANL
ncbi:hypothetical protein [uncultured Limosilactobacillus sp.]|uniref:hypothetical protein n=1 Tax=uncultured Limosilactobacillus sp. TaxID=2837629 RepID=UPI002598886E|nr:hypothetical protein [uncultured Limosilactobacillus sp.]